MFISAAFLWRWSFARSYSVHVQHQTRTEHVYSYRFATVLVTEGKIVATARTVETREPSLLRFYRKMPVGPFVVFNGAQVWTQPIIAGAPVTRWHRGGFAFEPLAKRPGAGQEAGGTVQFPCWVLLVGTAILPLRGLMALRRARRR